MKFLIGILSLLFLVSCQEEKKEDEKDTSTTVQVNDQGSDISDERDRFAPHSESQHVIKYPNGKVKEQGLLRGGKRVGVWTYFYESGIKQSECTYNADIKQGKVVVWHANGAIRYIGYFENDQRKGVWRFYDENGKEVKEEKY
jgi:hypothetical protein